MINLEHIKDLVIKPALESIDLYSIPAERLILFTGYVESRYQYLKQFPKGPAKGFWQMEPETYYDLIKWLNYDTNKNLKEKILKSLNIHDFLDDDALIWNLRYAVIMTRCKYLTCKPPLPSIQDAEAMSNYHKTFYNGGGLGKADVDKNTKIYKELFNVA